jgi:hypothetical protein
MSAKHPYERGAFHDGMYPEVELSGNENSERWHTKDLYRNKRIT